MIKTIKFYTKLICNILRKNTIGKDEFKEEYNKVAKTYSLWTDQMGRQTDKMIKPEYVSNVKTPKVLDFACGTGYISKKLLELENNSFHITSVDISKEMLAILARNAKNKVHIVNCDGLEFLKNTNEKYDAIFCGWALPYFNHKELLKLFYNVLNKDGIVAVISNNQGTLCGVESIFLKVMKDNQSQIIKPMDIRYNLPNDRDGLSKWFMKYGFKPLEVDEGEVSFSFETASELHDWIVRTGAVAGTAKIFNDYNIVKENIIKEIENKMKINGEYRVNHKFVHGIFKRVQ